MYQASFVLLLFFAPFVLFYGKWKVWLPRLLKQGTARHLANKYLLCTGSLVSPVGLFGTPEPSWAHACPRTSVLTLDQYPSSQIVMQVSGYRQLAHQRDSCWVAQPLVLPLSCPCPAQLQITFPALYFPWHVLICLTALSTRRWAGALFPCTLMYHQGVHTEDPW